MNTTVNACGLECPKPVIQTKQALERMEDGILEVMVDNKVAMENVSKFAKSQQLEYTVGESEGVYRITITKGVSTGIGSDSEEVVAEKGSSGLVIMVGKDAMGEGSEELGQVLIKGYFYTLTETTPLPESIVFLNSGAKLTCEGSVAVENIRILEEKGVEILTCGTCLDYYQLKDKLVVGGISNMYTIVETTNRAKNTIRI